VVGGGVTVTVGTRKNSESDREIRVSGLLAQKKRKKKKGLRECLEEGAGRKRDPSRKRAGAGLPLTAKKGRKIKLGPAVWQP